MGSPIRHSVFKCTFLDSKTVHMGTFDDTRCESDNAQELTACHRRDHVTGEQVGSPQADGAVDDQSRSMFASTGESTSTSRRVLITGTRSGAGKTTVTVAIIAALRARGIPVVAFKCGPDYIDPMFLTAALGVPARNLDPFFSTPDDLRAAVAKALIGGITPSGGQEHGHHGVAARQQNDNPQGVDEAQSGYEHHGADAGQRNGNGDCPAPVLPTPEACETRNAPNQRDDNRDIISHHDMQIQESTGRAHPLRTDLMPIAVLEGVMGYYDGIGSTPRASTFSVADATQTPAILVLDTGGMAASTGAILQGFARYRDPSHLVGVIVNKASSRTYCLVEPLIREAGLVPLGYLPRNDSTPWPTRHLGLFTPAELAHLTHSIADLSACAEQYLNLDELLRIASTAPELYPPAPPSSGHGNTNSEIIKTYCNIYIDRDSSTSLRPRPEGGCSELRSSTSSLASAERASSFCSQPASRYPTDEGALTGDSSKAGWVLPRQGASRVKSTLIKQLRKEQQQSHYVTVAVAHDESFSFVYAETLELLETLGAEIAYFSPLHDARPPEADALYLPGGYPELHAEGLSANLVMRTTIKEWVTNGVPTIAECGGFMYLLDDIDGYPMAGVIGGSATLTGKLQRFGYATLTATHDTMLARQGDTLPVHEFHYCDSTAYGNAFIATKASTGQSYPCGYATDTLYAGFPHLYLPAVPQAAWRFVERARMYREARS